MRILSGIQPTGSIHLGNYLGAIRRWVAAQGQTETLICIVDLHAITNWQDPAALRQGSREMAAALLASGIDPARTTLFKQSANPDHAQLAWVLNCIARVGWLDRMTQFKEKAGRDREGASVGLYAYPVLQAADILVYQATHVPVGEDQKQHLELARDIAARFNRDYDVELFPLPEPVIGGPAARVMSPARRHGQDVQVRPIRPEPHQPDRRRGYDRVQDTGRRAPTPRRLPADPAELAGASRRRAT